MPLCRHSTSDAPSSSPRAGREIVRLSRYVVTRRAAPRAANDNRHLGAPSVWPWAIAMAMAPAISAALVLAQLI